MPTKRRGTRTFKWSEPLTVRLVVLFDPAPRAINTPPGPETWLQITAQPANGRSSRRERKATVQEVERTRMTRKPAAGGGKPWANLTSRPDVSDHGPLYAAVSWSVTRSPHCQSWKERDGAASKLPLFNINRSVFTVVVSRKKTARICHMIWQAS